MTRPIHSSPAKQAEHTQFGVLGCSSVVQATNGPREESNSPVSLLGHFFLPVTRTSGTKEEVSHVANVTGPSEPRVVAQICEAVARRTAARGARDEARRSATAARP